MNRFQLPFDFWFKKRTRGEGKCHICQSPINIYWNKEGGNAVVCSKCNWTAGVWS